MKHKPFNLLIHAAVSGLLFAAIIVIASRTPLSSSRYGMEILGPGAVLPSVAVTLSLYAIPAILLTAGIGLMRYVLTGVSMLFMVSDLAIAVICLLTSSGGALITTLVILSIIHFLSGIPLLRAAYRKPSSQMA